MKKAEPIASASNKITTIIFDLFGVVISFDEDIVYTRLARHCDNPERTLTAMRGLVSQDILIRGRQTLSQLHEQLRALYGLRLDLPVFEAAWLEPYSGPMLGMAALIESLASRYKLILLSNVDPFYWQALLKRHPELACFSAHLLSWQLGMAKPDQEVFLHAIKTANVPASQCFFIDDKRENIEAASAVGLLGHQFVDADVLKQALEQVGVI
jgi:HAD superfamily hydrolase (TIGR01509 family)